MEHRARSSIISRRRERLGRGKPSSSKTGFLAAIGVHLVLIVIAVSLTWPDFGSKGKSTVALPEYHPGEEIYMRAMANAELPASPEIKPLNVMRIPVFQDPSFAIEFDLPPPAQLIPDTPALKSPPPSTTTVASPKSGNAASPGAPD